MDTPARHSPIARRRRILRLTGDVHGTCWISRCQSSRQSNWYKRAASGVLARRTATANLFRRPLESGPGTARHRP